MYKMTEQGFNPTDDALRRLHPLSLMNTVGGMRHTHQTGQLGDDLRSFSVSMGFTQVSDYVGPRGTELNYCITNKGKTNKVGKHEYSACAPCVNPMLDNEEAILFNQNLRDEWTELKISKSTRLDLIMLFGICFQVLKTWILLNLMLC